MDACCEHCGLQYIGGPLDDLMVDWPDEFLTPPWLAAATDIWVTRDGQVIPIRELEDSHLLNIQRMLAQIEGEMNEVDEEGNPTSPSPPLALFDRKVKAIEAEIQRRAG